MEISGATGECDESLEFCNKKLIFVCVFFSCFLKMKHGK